jgi:glycosyltransferase involved in cell wall biosynthesis
MHILIISRSYPNRINRSSGNFVLNQVEALAKKNIQVGTLGVYNISIRDFIKPKNINKLGFYKELKTNIVKYSFLYPVVPKLHYINHLIKYHIWKRLFIKYIKEYGKPDLIHLHTFEPGRIAIWAKKKYGIPYVVTEHTSDFFTNTHQKWHTPLATQVYSNSDFNIGVSNASCKFLEQRFKQNFHLIPNLVDTSRFKLKPSTNNDYIQFINVAYLAKIKRQDLLISAFHKAFNNDSKYKLKIIGNGGKYDELTNLIQELGNTNIELMGYRTQDEIIEELHKSDYFAFSSEYETFGVVLIEAMSCGLPILSTSCGGPISIINNENLGLLTKVNDLQAYTEAMKKIVTLQYDSNYIREYAISNFSNEAIADKLIMLYKGII